MKKKLKTLILVVVSLKLLLLFATIKDLKMNPDEEENYEIALNSQSGKGYTLFDGTTGKYKLTAFHGSFPVFVYEFLIKNNIRKEVWVVAFYLLFYILSGISIYYFYLLSLEILGNEKFAWYATITYAFYPSVILYLGTLFFYENMVMPLSIIIIYRLWRSLQSGFSRYDFLLIPIVVTLSSLFRPQAIVLYLMVFFVFLICILVRKNYALINMVAFTAVLMILTHLPLVNKNKELWGEYILSTQTGFELLQGHNPTARGSWMGNWRKPESANYQYVHSKIPDIMNLNELEESKAREKLALQWIKENPLSEVKLIFRKLGIYFTPNNYKKHHGGTILNPLTFVVHIFFLIYLVLIVIKRNIRDVEWLALAPIAGSVLLSLIFFVGHRWRYYADPFIVLFAWQAFMILRIYFSKAKSKSLEL